MSLPPDVHSAATEPLEARACWITAPLQAGIRTEPLPPLADGEVLGFVDVPGHEKLVRNMLAGATGIDHVILVIAADDGPMPQTREHLEIIELLGIPRALVAITKCDRAGAGRVALDGMWVS